MLKKDMHLFESKVCFYFQLQFFHIYDICRILISLIYIGIKSFYFEPQIDSKQIWKFKK